MPIRPDEPVRRLLGTSRDLLAEDRLDLLIHAVAQAPETTDLAIAGEGPDRGRLQLLARAYGLEDRIRFVRSADETAVDGVPVWTSRRNLQSAVVLPGPGPGLSLTGTDGVGDLVEALYGPDDAGPALPTGDDTPLAGHRVAIVTNHPAHYRIPLFNALARRLRAAGAELLVLFESSGYARRAWMRPAAREFDHRTLRSVGLRLSASRHPHLPYDLERSLRRFRPSVVIAGGFSPLVAGRAERYARRHGASFGVWSGEIPSTAARRAGGRTDPRRRLVERATFGLVYGTPAAEYLATLRPSLPVAVVRNTVPPPGPPAARTTATIPHVLTVADLSTPGKGIDTLIDAIARIEDAPWRLTVAGGGPPLGALRARAAPLGDRVRFTGAVASDRVGELYAEADVFAFPSRVDVFGLVLVEAMSLGIPVVTSSVPGAAQDLCRDGTNALVVRSGDPGAWAEALRRVLTDPDLRRNLGDAGARTVDRRWTIEHSADAFVAGIRLGVFAGRTAEGHGRRST